MKTAGFPPKPVGKPAFMHINTNLNRRSNHAGQRSRGRSRRAAQIDIDPGGTHPAEEVAVVGRNDRLAVGQDTASTSAAKAASRLGDDRACLCQNLNIPCLDRFAVDAPGSRGDDQLETGRNLFAL